MPFENLKLLLEIPHALLPKHPLHSLREALLKDVFRTLLKSMTALQLDPPRVDERALSHLIEAMVTNDRHTLLPVHAGCEVGEVEYRPEPNCHAIANAVHQASLTGISHHTTAILSSLSISQLFTCPA